MPLVRTAAADDIDKLIDLETRLFHEDAAVYERYADPTWPAREGRADFEELLASPDAIVLIALVDRDFAGFLVGYTTEASPTRQPVTYAVLRSLYVAADHRRSGVGTALTARFLAWARSQQAVEAQVSSYAANEPAQRFYERHGFTSQSISRVHPL